MRKQLRLRGRDPHGEIRAEILCRMPAWMSKTEGWRPIWLQIWLIWGQLGFRAQLAHPWTLQGFAPPQLVLLLDQAGNQAIRRSGNQAGMLLLEQAGKP